MTDKKRRRSTRQRQVVLDELKKLTSHPTAAELYEFARWRLPKLSLATVYRNLELLVGDGIIQKLEISGAESRFDGNMARHFHVRCVRCGRVDDLHDVPADVVGDRFKTSRGYEILGYHLEFKGICPECGSSPVREDEEMPPREGD